MIEVIEDYPIQEEINAVPIWWHSIPFGNGFSSSGVKSEQQLNYEMNALHLPDLSGKTVLDIGAWDGFFSFEAEKRGAKKIVALDHYVWSLDLSPTFQYWEECKRRGVIQKDPKTIPEFWHPDTLPGKKGFNTAKHLLSSKVEPVVGDFMQMDISQLGEFDVVLYLGVLYHMENPFEAIKRVAKITREMAVIETLAMVIPLYENVPLCQFFESNEVNHDVTNWWAPNLAGLESLCRAAGFKEIKVFVGPPEQAKYRLRQITHYRAIVQVWK